MGKVKLSIIIVNYNTKALLRQCLESVISHEVIVVDNGSKDGSVEMVEKEFPKVELIKNKSNLGFAKANNQALRQAQGRYILFLNSDTIVPKETTSELLSYLEKHPEIGVITPRLELRNGKLDPDCHRGFPQPWAAFCYFSSLEKIAPKSKIFGQYHQGWKDLNTIHEIDSCCGAFLLTRKNILEEVGGFDEAYFFYGEDLDLCYRIKQKGWKIVYYPKVKAIHYKGASSGLRKESKDVARPDRAVLIKVARASADAMWIFYDKFYKAKYPLLVTLFVKIMIQIKKIFRILFAILATSNIRSKR